MTDGMGYADMEIRVMVGGDEIGVVAFYGLDTFMVQVVVGVHDPSDAPSIVAAFKLAADAMHAANWKPVDLSFEGPAFEDLGGEPAADVGDGLAHDGMGDDPSETGFPF